MGQNSDAACSGKAKWYRWKKAIKACSSLQLAGKTWRLPEKEELKSLIYCSDGTKTEEIKDPGSGHHMCGWSGGDKYEKEYDRPTIRSTVFPNTVASLYWSSSTYVAATTNAWVGSFSNGDVYYFPKSSIYYVRCVSTGP